MSKPTYKVTKKDRDQVNWRMMRNAIACFNYSTQCAPKMPYALQPVLRKLYPDDKDYITALDNHYKYFNSQPYMATMILGAVLAMEEQLGIEGKDTIQDFKAGIMGPTAGIGDSIFWFIIPGIFTPIAASLAFQGNLLGIGILLISRIAIAILRWNMFDYGYKMGTGIIEKLGAQLGIMTEAFGVLGLTVVGAMVTTVVTVSCPLEWTLSSGGVINIQNLLNTLLPALLPISFTAVMVAAMSKQKFTMTQLIMITLVISIVCGALGILG